jgi:hypothetical protein
VDWHDPSSLLDEWSVQEADQGRDRPEDIQQAGIETIVGREHRLEFAPGKKLLEAEVIRGGMCLEVPARHRGQLLTVEGLDGSAEHSAVHDSAEALVIGRNVITNQPKIR